MLSNIHNMTNAFSHPALKVTVTLLLYFIIYNEAARILGVFPTPSISHQIAFRPLTQELARRGHEVTVITPDPAFGKGQGPINLTEIGVHDISYEIWEKFIAHCTGKKSDLHMQIVIALEVFALIFEKQMVSQDVQRMFKDKNQKFDLLLIEDIIRPTLALSHKYKVPVISVSSFGSAFDNFANLGVPQHPLLYPSIFNQRIYNLTTWEKINELYNYLWRYYYYLSHEKMENMLVKRIFGSDTPPLSKLSNNVDMLFLNVHPIWYENRPVPPSVIYMGGIHQNPSRDLPKDLKLYLDSSKNGVIYVSFGTNVNPMFLPQDILQMFIKVFSELSYDVIWKWDTKELKDKPKNIKFMKWVPQADLLKHPKLKLFITQGGLQSTDETILAGVPVIGIPMLADQWFNTEKYVHHGIGLQLDIESLTEEKFSSAIMTVIDNKSYRENVARLRQLINDQPQKPLERAIWWIEHVLRHGGGRHLRSPAANLSWAEILELKLVTIVLVSIFVIIILILVFVFTLYSFLKTKLFSSVKIKRC